MKLARWSTILSIGRSESRAPGRDEDFIVDCAGRQLPVRVRRHARSRALRLRYDAARGELKLTLPLRHRLREARLWVEQQHAWVERQISGGIAPTVILPGASLPWDGADIGIDWQSGYPRTPRIADGRLQVGGPEESLGPRIRRWLVARARAEFTDRTQRMAGAEGLPLSDVRVGDPRARWGSCSSSGIIRYSWRLVMGPEFVRHAIVAHEVAHLAHMNHGPDFHTLNRRLGGHAVDASRAWLKQHGPALHALRFD